MLSKTRFKRFSVWGLVVISGLSALGFSWHKSHFVEIKDKQFQLAGHPYAFVGVNYWYAPLLGMNSGPGDRARLVRELDSLKRLGLTNLRVLAMAEKSSATTLNTVAQEAPGQFSEAWFDGLDFAISEMDKRGIKVVLCLTNYWNWSGGMPQYVSWSGGGPVVGERVPWPEQNRYVIQFYNNIAAQRLVDRATEKLVARRNHYSGRAYSEDPTIMAWQLCNEARPGMGQQTALIRQAMLDWFAHASTHLRGLGIHQLISTGCEGVFGCNGDEDLFRKLNALPNIDYITAHLWPQNWRWYDPKRSEETFPPMKEKSLGFLQQHMKIAADLGKPLVLEEFGIARDGGNYSGDGTTKKRDRFLTMIGDAWLSSVRSHGPFQGMNVWSWSGEGRPRDASGKLWKPGDPILGDNPSEPQGWYSIHDGDKATTDLLSALITTQKKEVK